MKTWIIIFFALVLLIGIVRSIFSTNKTSNNSVYLLSSPTPAPSLVEKIKNRQNPLNKKFVIQGQEIRIGETWDSVAEKLGKTAVKTKVAQDLEFGQIVEHQYKDYSILVAREPKEKLYYIVWDIYPNSQ